MDLIFLLQAMDDLLFGKPEVSPVATCSSSSGYRLASTSASTIDSPPRSDTPATPRSIFAADAASTSGRKRKAAVGESDVERRHQEKMSRLDRYLDILDDISKKLK